MGSGIGDGNLFRTYRGGYYSSGGLSKKLQHSQDSIKPNESAEKIFSDHDKKIRVSNDERFYLNDLKDKISDSLSQDLTIKRINVIGSTTKDTQIKNKAGNDIDIMVELDEKVHGKWLTQENGSRNSLEKFKRTLQKDPELKNVEMRVDRNAVTLEIGNLKADVIPSFPYHEGGHQIADTSEMSKWKNTNPRLSTRLFNNLDKKHDHKLSELTREVKYWNQKNGKPLSSYHIECMTYDYFRNNKPKNGENSSKVNTREFFERMPWYLKRHVRDPVYGEKADGYLSDNNRRKVISNTLKSTRILRKAEKEARNGNIEESNRLYKEFLED